MSEFVSLEEARHHLRYDHEDNDGMISLYLQTAEKAVKNYITDEVTPEAAPDIRLAILWLVGYYDANRDGTQEHRVHMDPKMSNYLPDIPRQILYPYRTPSVH